MSELTYAGLLTERRGNLATNGCAIVADYDFTRALPSIKAIEAELADTTDKTNE
jgi:hypothetical protein